MCVYYCDFPALFPAFLPCRWSQSPLTRLFLFKEWPQCLGICSCVDQVTQSIFFLSAERRLVLSWWLNGKYVTVSSTTLFAKLQISTTPLPTCVCCFGYKHKNITDDAKRPELTETLSWLSSECWPEFVWTSAELHIIWIHTHIHTQKKYLINFF